MKLIFCPQIQALTNQLFSNVRSRTPVLQYLLVHVISYQVICTCWWSRKYLTHILKAQWFLGQPQYAHGFSNFSLILCLQYAWNNRIYINVWHLSTLCTFIFRHLSKICKAFAIFLVKKYFQYFVSFLSIMEIPMFSRMCLFLRLGHFDGYFRVYQLNLCLVWNESQLIYPYKHAYKKECTCIPRKRKPF